jgi:hypothetical protein
VTGPAGVPVGSDRLAVVGEVGQPRGPGREGIGDWDPGGFELGDEAGVLGGFGAFLADPLGDVLDRVPLVQGAQQPGSGVRVIVDYVDGINRSFGFMQGGLSFGWFAEVG